MCERRRKSRCGRERERSRASVLNICNETGTRLPLPLWIDLDGTKQNHLATAACGRCRDQQHPCAAVQCEPPMAYSNAVGPFAIRCRTASKADSRLGGIARLPPHRWHMHTLYRVAHASRRWSAHSAVLPISTKLTRQRRTDRLGGVLQHSLTHWQCALDNSAAERSAVRPQCHC